MQKSSPKKKVKKPQRQRLPGKETKMQPKPVSDDPTRKGSDRLKNKIAFITGGDSGIGKAVTILFAKEGADIAISYLNEHEDAKDTKSIIEERYERECLQIPGDARNGRHCISAINNVIKQFRSIDI